MRQEFFPALSERGQGHCFTVTYKGNEFCIGIFLKTEDYEVG
jgi:hypothetical protein